MGLTRVKATPCGALIGPNNNYNNTALSLSLSLKTHSSFLFSSVWVRRVFLLNSRENDFLGKELSRKITFYFAFTLYILHKASLLTYMFYYRKSFQRLYMCVCVCVYVMYIFYLGRVKRKDESYEKSDMRN